MSNRERERGVEREERERETERKEGYESEPSGNEPIRDYRAVGARARCAFTRALNTVNALSGTTSLLSPPSATECNRTVQFSVP